MTPPNQRRLQGPTLPSDAPAPIRTCVGCRARRPQTELVRCVLGTDGSARVDRHGAGRGAWLCGPGCLEPAIRRRGFDRAWRTAVRTEQLERLGDQLGHRPQVGTAESGARLKQTTKG